MKIYKIAAGIPAGFKILRTTIDLKTGKKKEEWVRGPGSVCPSKGSAEDLKDAKNLQQIAEHAPEGFGATKVNDAGYTAEHYEQHRQKDTPIPATPFKEEDEWTKISPTPAAPQKQGYGV